MLNPQDVSGKKGMKEGDQGRNQKSTAKDKKREPMTKLQKKSLFLKREDPKKKTLSRNRSPSLSNALIRHPSKVSNKSCKPNRQKYCCPANRA
jgi:hypothetical protein